MATASAGAYTSIVEMIELYRKQQVSPVEVAKQTVERYEAWEPKLNAFVATLDWDVYLAEARQSETRWRQGRPLGALDGIPISIKDTVPVAGFATLKGSQTADPSRLETQDAPAAARLREAGALLIGKTTTPEFGWKTVTDSPLSGITRNPWNLQLTPGGSSGGSCAATVAGIGFASIGTDAAGSIRIPCAFTGLVGFKPTAGRAPRFPPSALGTMGHTGPIARHVSDAILLTRLIAVDDYRDWRSSAYQGFDEAKWQNLESAKLKIAYSPDLGFGQIEPEVQTVVQAAMRLMAQAGLALHDVDLDLSHAKAIYQTIFAAAQGHAVAKFGDAQRQRVDPDLLELLQRLPKPSLSDYLNAQAARGELARELRDFHRHYDFLCVPTVAVSPFAADQDSEAQPSGFNWLEWSHLTHPFNLSGQPALTLPCGRTGMGMPVGLQLIGDLGSDEKLLQFGATLERILAPLYPCDEPRLPAS